MIDTVPMFRHALLDRVEVRDVIVVKFDLVVEFDPVVESSSIVIQKENECIAFLSKTITHSKQ